MATKVISVLGVPLVTEDRNAGAAITPGHLVTRAATVVVHATAAGNAAPTFALERDELGSEITVAYASGDAVKVGHFAPGMRVNALIASGENIADGQFLESAGDGTLRAMAVDAATDENQREAVVAIAQEAVNNTAGPGDARIVVAVV